MSELVLQVDRLNKWYGRVHALKDFSLQVGRGQVCGILGPNGSGKTTALGIVLGVLRPSSGSFSWFGRGSSESLKRRVGALLEQPNFYPWLSAEKNLQMVALIRGVKNPNDEITKALQMVKLEDARKERFQTFSLGMKQRLAIASALLGRPEVLVLDEPTNGIDAEGIAEIRKLIVSLAREGVTVILASHILDEVEKVCTDVIMLKNGNILDAGKITDVLSHEDYIEISSEDHTILIEALKELPYCASLEDLGQVVRMRVRGSSQMNELNRFLVSKGIYLTHLVRRKTSLEAHFLNLLEKNHDSTH